MGKGGSTSSVTVPAWMEEAAKRNVTRGDKISLLGPVPLSYGPTVAGFTDSQIAGFDNTSNTASAFGLNAPGAFSMGTPVEYANGVRGYSAAPLFEQKMNAFAEARPGQKSYIDSFFIDPFSGNYGYNATMPIDYTLAFPQTPTAPVDTGGGSDAGGSVDTGYTYTPVTPTEDAADPGLAIQPNPEIFAQTPEIIQTSQQVLATDPSNPDYNTAFENVYNWQSEQADNDPYGQSTGYGITTEILDATGGAEAWLPPTPSDNSAPVGIVGNNDTGSNSFAQTMANILTPFDDKSYVDGKLQNTGGNDNSSNDSSGSDSSSSDCVIATHAVASGAFNPQTKRAAVVWCMNNLHDRWWGEAVRRGYRHLGRKKIEQGKAREHYDEFRRYIDFASGKKRTLRGALTFTLRTTQFFVVGMLNKEA